MADDTTGYNQEETPAGALPVARVPAASSPMDDLDKARSDIMAQQNRLMTMLEERNKPNPSEFWGALARGFGDPNAKWFSQGAAGAAGNLGQLEETNRARELQTAQMRMQLAQSQLGMRERMAGMKMLDSMGKSGDATGATGAGQAGSNTIEPSGLRNITGQDIARLSMLAPDIAKALEAGIKLDQDRFKIAQNGIVFDTRTNTYLNIPVPGQEQKPFTTPYGTLQMTPYDFSQFQAAQQKGRGREWIENYKSTGVPAVNFSAPPIAAPSAAATKSSGMRTVEEQASEQARLTAEATEKGKFSATTREGIFNAADAAPRLSSLAQSNIQLINDNPDAVGVIASPTVANALISLIGRARVGSGGKGGEAELDTSNIENAIRLIGPKQLQGESNEAYQSRKERNVGAAMQIVRNLAEMELNFAKSFLKGQGAVSNMERNITKSLGGSISDSRLALMAKNDLLIKTAEYDEKIRDAFKDWQRSNPRDGAEMFKGSDEEKVLRNSYNKEVSEINSKYFSSKKSSANPDVKALQERLRNQLER